MNYRLDSTMCFRNMLLLVLLYAIRTSNLEQF